MFRGLQINTELTRNISAQCDKPNVWSGHNPKWIQGKKPKIYIFNGVYNIFYPKPTKQKMTTKFPSITFYKSNVFSDITFSDFQSHDFWTAGRKRRQTAPLNESFKPWTNLARAAALNFLAVNGYTFSWSSLSFLTLSHWHTHSHALTLPPLCFGDPLVHFPVSPFLSFKHRFTHTKSST